MVDSLQILQGNCLSTLKTLPHKSVHCCVTSPPYWGLRDYGCEGQIGLETTPQEYVNNISAVFRLVYNVLRDDGTLWLNIGDSYNGYKGNACRDTSGSEYAGFRNQPARESGHGLECKDLKPKDLIGIPWRVAFALQAEGWYLRSDIIWHKPNPMPESVTDRCTRSHEYIFLLSKSKKYYFDAEAIKEPCSAANILDFARRKTLNNKGRGKGSYEEIRPDLCRNRADYMPGDFRRNKRDVWTVQTKPCKEAHFAVFPEKLIEPCILAGCPVGGIVLDPFAGSGTTGRVALELGRKAILCELNQKYIPIIKRQTNIPVGLNL